MFTAQLAGGLLGDAAAGLRASKNGSQNEGCEGLPWTATSANRRTGRTCTKLKCLEELHTQIVSWLRKCCFMTKTLVLRA